MERKIGEIFEYNGEWYQCIPDTTNNNCNNCFFQKNCSNITGYCSSTERSDGKSVVFKKLEKVGETYRFGKLLMQQYRIFTEAYIPKGFDPVCVLCRHGKVISIEIKQIKEDMEETKLNIKPFSLEAAKAGKPVCTRDGRKARIICFDAKCSDEQILIVLVDCGKEESIYFYATDGKCIDDFSNFDLMMLSEKKEGWMNIYSNGDNHRVGSPIYNSKEEALNNKASNAIDTVKIEWKE